MQRTLLIAVAALVILHAATATASTLEPNPPNVEVGVGELPPPLPGHVRTNCTVEHVFYMGQWLNVGACVEVPLRESSASKADPLWKAIGKPRVGWGSYLRAYANQR